MHRQARLVVRFHASLAAALLSYIAGTSLVAQGPITFVDRTPNSGINDVGISFGVSAGDVDGDGWPDLFASGHYTDHPRLWWNLHNGYFWDVTVVMSPFPSGDMHGAQWVDLDGDGGQELVLLRGAAYGLGAMPKSVYRRYGLQLFDIAPWIGLDVPLMRARTPLAVDFDHDGRLDVYLSALRRPDGLSPPSPYRQLPTGVFGGEFSDAGPTTGYNQQSDTLFAVLGDIDGDQQCDMLCHGFPARVYSTAGGTMTDITAMIGLPSVPTMNDAVIADFDGDGYNEVYVARDSFGSAFHVEGSHRVEFRAIVQGNERTIRFGVPGGQHWMVLDWGPLATLPRSKIFVGWTGYHPTMDVVGIDSSNPWNMGIRPHVPGQDHGVYVGWDASASEWIISVTSPIWDDLMVRAVTGLPVLPPYAVGWNPAAPTPSDLLLKRVNGVLQDITVASGIPSTLRGRSAVAADFDNDMDLDLYVLTSTPSHNTHNVMLLNNGLGVFQAVQCGDAIGSPNGIGDSAITLDYDQDGRVDLFLVNGDATAFRQSGPPADAFGDDGPAQLLHNEAQTGNHWLAIHLVGTAPNREGIGARIEVTAGGKLQIRENGGGMHRYSQNHGIHFGLGPNTTATKVEVVWPNGQRTTQFNVASDQMLVVTQ